MLPSAPTKVIALENTLRGVILPQDNVIAISEFAHSRGIKMHLDGARLWHVAAETGTPLNVLCEPFDSISLCFSKCLGNVIPKHSESLLSHNPQVPRSGLVLSARRILLLKHVGSGNNSEGA